MRTTVAVAFFIDGLLLLGIAAAAVSVSSSFLVAEAPFSEAKDVVVGDVDVGEAATFEDAIVEEASSSSRQSSLGLVAFNEDIKIKGKKAGP